MIDCLIIGDSIGVGIAQHLPECHREAYSGIASRTWKVLYSKQVEAKSAIISLGSNDHFKIDTLKELIEIRSKVAADKVMWILPAKRFEAQRDAVREAARINKDMVIEIPDVSKDGVHPTGSGYKQLAKATHAN